jgi:hypothetical protein
VHSLVSTLQEGFRRFFIEEIWAVDGQNASPRRLEGLPLICRQARAGATVALLRYDRGGPLQSRFHGKYSQDYQVSYCSLGSSEEV